MAVQIIQALHIPVITEEGHEIVQADEALTAHHLADHIIGEVALVGGHGTGVGVGGGKGLLSYLQQVSEAGVIQVGDVRQDIVLLQFRNQLLAEVGQAVLADVAGTDFILTVPGEGDGLDSVLCQQADPVQVASQGRAVFYTEEGSSPVGLERLFHISAGAATFYAVRELVHLADEVVPIGLVIADGILTAAFIGDKNGVELGPMDPFGDAGQGQDTLGIIQSIGPKTAAVLAVSQSITVQIDQCIRFHSYIPAFQTYGGMRPVGSLGRADATPGKIGR